MMKPSELKKLMIQSLEPGANTEEIAGRLESEGISYDFNGGFTEKVTTRLFSEPLIASHDLEFRRNLSLVFYRIAITGIAAIIILMLSIFIAQDSFSFNSFLGLGDSIDESIVYLLTGN
jgi:hypothetical protein